MKLKIRLLSKDLKLQIVHAKFADRVLDYYIRNRENLKTWEPARQDNFYTLSFHKTALKEGNQKAVVGKEYRFIIFEKKDVPGKKVIGVLSFSGIIKGPFLSCFAGYSIDSSLQNRGYMTQALEAGIDFIFNTIGLHRIEANIMPRNSASVKVVSKLGFKNEGISPKYLKINGEWEDHVHMVLRNREQE